MVSRVQVAGKPGRWRPLLLAALLLLLAASGWWRLHAVRSEAAGGARVLRIGYAVEAPYAFIDAQGRVVGESAASAGLVAQRLGWRIEWVQTEFDLLIADLLDGRFDVIDAGLFITPERARQVRFAAPRLRVVPALLVRSGNPLDLRSWQQVKEQPRLRLAVVGGSVEEARLRASGFSRLLSVPDARAGAAAVLAERVDGLAVSLPTVRQLAGQHHGLEAVPVADADSVSYVAAAFRPQDARLLRAWNGAQAAVLGTPRHLAAIAPYGFGREDVVVPAAAVR